MTLDAAARNKLFAAIDAFEAAVTRSLFAGMEGAEQWTASLGEREARRADLCRAINEMEIIAAARASVGDYADGLMAALMIAADFEGYASIDDITHGAPFDLIKQELDAAKRGEKRRSTPSPDADVGLGYALRTEAILRRIVAQYNDFGTDHIDMHEACQWIASLDKTRAAYASTTAEGEA